MFKYLASMACVVAVTVYFVGCSDDSSPAQTTYTYNGPGSEWTMSNTGTSYTLNKDEGSGNTISVTATSSELATGHLLMTVSAASATGTAGAPSVGDTAFAVDIPGTALFLKPLEANSETVVAVRSGSCPTTDFVANWVIGQRARTNVAAEDSQDWFGSINWTVANNEVYFPLYRSIEAPTTALGGEDPSGSSPQTFGACSSGKINDYSNSCATSTDNDIYFTDSGLIIVASCKGDSSDESHIIGMPQTAISSASSIYGDYAGFAFVEGDDTYPIVATLQADGSDHDAVIQFRSGSDLTTTTSTVTASFPNANVNAPANGFIHGTMDGTCSNGDQNEFDGSCEVICSLAENVNSSGRNMIFCVSQDLQEEDRRITMLLVENT